MEIQPVPWWNRRSRMERRFIYSIATLLLVSVGLAIGNCNLGEKILRHLPVVFVFSFFNSN